MAKNKRSVTIIDVARVAGVSVSTVSRVINSKVDVSEDTHLHVSQVIEELGYQSSLAARSMRSHKTGVIGLIMPDVAAPFSVEVIRGVNRAIIDLKEELLIYTDGDIRLSSSAVREQQYVSLLNNSVTDGVMLVNPCISKFTSASPVVSIDPNVPNPSGPAVVPANYRGAYAATQYLIELGHRRIGYIGGRTDLQAALQRKQAFENAHKEAGIPLDPDLMKPGEFLFESGYKGGQELLKMAKAPTAIFASNDLTAMGVFQAATELNMRIPDDLSVVGYDNIPDAAYMNLTTVDQFIVEMGYTATHMLYDLIQGKPRSDEVHSIHAKMVVRGSCRSL